MHYKRAARGQPLTDTTPVAGSPSGHGLYGVLDDDGQTVLCHECGQRRRILGSHLGADHGMTAAEYKRKHGLPRGRGLLSRDAAEERSALSRALVGSVGWARLEARRDPTAASRAKTPDSYVKRGRQRAELAERAAQNGRAARLGRIACCPVCQATWCQLPETNPRITCSPACWHVWQSWGNKRQVNRARDARIYAQVVTLGRPTDQVAAQFGITRTRVRQIVRRLTG
ncbi:MucR family transcriptional regulator [Nakamurella aerolata]|uniref:ROS/MUCR transcriptional regulator protein n=1 Tax=Nakamurella aerolata TaxID=1656892 RepID=A0A849ACR6_9ACTN|nr:MucR family transcriptional regulator [Nakamurella aerolata]NNG36958.1 hypothetical protein [Nakamurella aerolata]